MNGHQRDDTDGPAPDIDYAALRGDIECWARDLGFAAIGVANTDLADYAPAYRRWLAERLHGDMGYLARNVAKRLAPAALLPGTVRVISARMDYLGTAPPAQNALPVNDGSAYIARYALGRDYHKTVRRRLARLAKRIERRAGGGRFRAFTDSAPVLEKPLGEKAGLGWIGKNTLLLGEEGSWFFLGEIYTDLPLPATPKRPLDAPGCGSCRACIRVCPTNAIVAPGKLDATRCISYLTIEHKGTIPVALRDAVGNRVFGCDDCQIVCPWNRFARRSAEADFAPRHGLDNATLAELLAWDEATFLARTQGMAIRRVSYAQWVRNLAVAAGNAPPDATITAGLRARRPGASAMVREHIDWALARQSAPTKATPTTPGGVWCRRDAAAETWMPTERLAPHMLGTARDEPPHFAGRRSELTTLAHIHEKAARTGKPPKGLVLVDGVQGVGKTQLLEHFVGTRAESPARLSLTTNGLGEKPELLFVLMLGAVGRETAARKLAGASDRITGVGAAGAQARMDRSRSQWRLDSLLELSRRQGLWAGRTLLLTIDEVQNVTAAERDVLRTLHEGAHGCPIVVLCAGLQHAAGRLSGTLIGADGRPNKAGISRFAERLTLGPLRRHETKAAFALGLAKFGVDVDDHQAETLAQRAMDFPQHIHGYLRGVLDAVGGRQRRLGPAHMARAVEQGDKARVAYYQERLSGTERSDLMPGLAGAMRRSEATEMSWEDARRHLAGRGAEDADAVLTSALEHGVLTIDSVRRISFGMPSFHGFLLALEATAPRRTGA